jgi:hypothetical protein
MTDANSHPLDRADLGRMAEAALPILALLWRTKTARSRAIVLATLAEIAAGADMANRQGLAGALEAMAVRLRSPEHAAADADVLAFARTVESDVPWLSAAPEHERSGSA